MSVEQIVEADVLVVGGGIAGCFAAIKAKEKGVTVVLVDKGYVGKSGQTPWADATAAFNPARGHNLEEWLNHSYTRGEYLNNREWTETVVKDSYARYQDLVSWGVDFLKDEQGNVVTIGNFESPMMMPHDGRIGKWPLVLRKQAIKSGVTILDRVMVVDLIKQSGSVVGAVGFPMNREGLFVFKAKATILCTGAGGFKPWGAWPIAELTADGHAMAYRVGAEITGKEFEDFHGRQSQLRGGTGGRGRSGPGLGPPRRGRQMFNAEGDAIPRRGPGGFTTDFEVHMGRWPFKDAEGNEIRVFGGAAPGMSVHTTEGVWPLNTQCATRIPGLYAAGDSLGTMVVGAAYSGMGFATATCSSTGARAGVAAGEYALQTEKPTVDEAELGLLKEQVRAPLMRKGGFSPRWVTQQIKNLMIPYFVSRFKHGERLQATLTLVEFIGDHLVPKLYATDPHDLRLAHETKNVVLNAEMRLRASLFRTESRGAHYREDYPRRRDPEWLAWVLLKEENGEMKAVKKSIPEAWWPDLSKPYEERYPTRFPGESSSG